MFIVKINDEVAKPFKSLTKARAYQSLEIERREQQRAAYKSTISCHGERLMSANNNFRYKVL